MSDDQFSPAQKRQFIIAGILMLLVLVIAFTVAFHGEEIFR